MKAGFHLMASKIGPTKLPKALVRTSAFNRVQPFAHLLQLGESSRKAMRSSREYTQRLSILGDLSRSFGCLVLKHHIH
ncbi:MAG: hypothetical protein CML99_07255 [Rhodobiaceae bacterium]|nr:hypothetical protein [Rhodobiaceae bacterium]